MPQVGFLKKKDANYAKTLEESLQLVLQTDFPAASIQAELMRQVRSLERQ